MKRRITVSDLRVGDVIDGDKVTKVSRVNGLVAIEVFRLNGVVTGWSSRPGALITVLRREK